MYLIFCECANVALSLAGDLDPAVSLHPLVPLKVAYKKLRMLVDMGCIFVGHGLKKDLRIISKVTQKHCDCFQTATHNSTAECRYFGTT